MLGLGIVSLLCMVFPAQVIYTQTFYSNQEEMDLSIFLFQFFAIQVVFYGASSIVSGLLAPAGTTCEGNHRACLQQHHRHRDVSRLCVHRPHEPNARLYIIAVGNPLGVFVKWPSDPRVAPLRIKLRPRIDLHDPALRETVRSACRRFS